MALNLSAIREALVNQIQAGVDVAVNVYAYMPGAPMFPCVAVVPAGEYVTFHGTFDSGPGTGGISYVNLDVHVVESGQVENAGRFVDDMLSTGTGNSVIEAIEADVTLGGVVESCVTMTGHVVNPGDLNATIIDGVIRCQIMVRK